MLELPPQKKREREREYFPLTSRKKGDISANERLKKRR